MASVSPQSFRHILLLRLLLLLLPLLGLSEWLVLHQARLSLLDNAQQQAQEIAKSQALTLELRQRELMDSPSPAIQCAPLSNATGPSASARCDSQRIIDQSLHQVLTQPFPPRQDGSVPLLAIFSPQGELMGHSALEASAPNQTHHCSGNQPSPTCGLIDQLTASDFLHSPLASDSSGSLRSDLPSNSPPQRILNDQWVIASHSVRLNLATPALDGTAPPEQALGQLVIALPTSHILAPLKRLSHWMLGATIGITGISVAVALYLSRELARPAEQLRDRLLAVQQQLTAIESNPPNPLKPEVQGKLPPTAETSFKIHEFQQLAGAFNQLIHCLNQRSTALEQATQEAHTASQLKSDFLAATSHELRTPLNALIGHIQLIQDGYCDSAEEEAACIGQVHQAALHLLKVLNELLDIARIEAGKFEFEHQQFELGQLLGEVLDMERSHLIQKGLTLTDRFHAEGNTLAPYWVQADRDKLKQVLLNVLGNAIKFTDKGSINVQLQPLCELESLPSSAEEPTIVLSITDTGIGIDQRQRQKLFRPFARASQLGRQPYEGSGLGLAISRTLMERMGGEIRLYSPGLGQGTTVELHLPLYPSPSDASAQESSPATYPSEEGCPL